MQPNCWYKDAGWISALAVGALILLDALLFLPAGCYVPKIEFHGHYHAATGIMETEVVFGVEPDTVVEVGP